MNTILYIIIVLAGFSIGIYFGFKIFERLYKGMCRITIRAHLPQYTGENETVCICGNLEALGNWKKHIPCKKRKNDIAEFAFWLPVNTVAEFKFTLGNWESVEKSDLFRDLENRKIEILKKDLFCFDVFNWANTKHPIIKNTLTGDFDFHKDFKSEFLKFPRDIIIYKPKSYKENLEKRYPVLYMHDGCNLFDAGTAFAGVEWQVDENVEHLSEQGWMQEIIVVGIDNTPHRGYEYTPTKCAKYGGGGADLYAKFIVEELKPFVDKEYRTLPQREYTGVMGSSLGGLVSLHLLWEYNHIFQHGGVVSPSLWWNNGEIIKRIENSKDENKNMRMWICMGTLEGSIDKETKESTAVKDTRKLAEILEKKKFLKNQDFVYYEVEGEGHDEGAWSRRIHLPLTYFFGNWEKSFEIQEHINKGHYYKEKVNLTDNSKADIPMSCS